MPHASNPSRRAWDLMLAEVKRMLQNQPVAGGAERGRGPQRGSRIGVVAAAPPGAEPKAVTRACVASPARAMLARWGGWVGLFDDRTRLRFMSQHTLSYRQVRTKRSNGRLRAGGSDRR